MWFSSKNCNCFPLYFFMTRYEMIEPTADLVITTTQIGQAEPKGDNWASQVVLVIMNLPANAGDMKGAGSVPGSGKSPGGGHDKPLQQSCLENPMDRRAWWAVANRVMESWTRLK